MIGTISGSLDGGYEVNGNQFRFLAEPDSRYTYTITPSEREGEAIWILALEGEGPRQGNYVSYCRERKGGEGVADRSKRKIRQHGKEKIGRREGG